MRRLDTWRKEMRILMGLGFGSSRREFLEVEVLVIEDAGRETIILGCGWHRSKKKWYLPLENYAIKIAGRRMIGLG
jgi:hypothetical protein